MAEMLGQLEEGANHRQGAAVRTGDGCRPKFRHDSLATLNPSKEVLRMAMSTQTATGQVMVDMNTTPLIDVMLVLLVLLIVTLPIQTHAVKIGMPANVPPTMPPVQSVELGIDFDGSLSWNGMYVSRATMDSYLADAARKNPQPEIHVNPDRLARYDMVAKVLADAQRLGATHIGFGGIEQYR